MAIPTGSSRERPSIAATRHSPDRVATVAAASRSVVRGCRAASGGVCPQAVSAAQANRISRRGAGAEREDWTSMLIRACFIRSAWRSQWCGMSVIGAGNGRRCSARRSE